MKTLPQAFSYKHLPFSSSRATGQFEIQDLLAAKMAGGNIAFDFSGHNRKGRLTKICVPLKYTFEFRNKHGLIEMLRDDITWSLMRTTIKQQKLLKKLIKSKNGGEWVELNGLMKGVRQNPPMEV